MSTDAIVLLKEDHKAIRGLFRKFQQTDEDASTRQGQIVDSILEALTVHTYLENEVMYPRVRELLPDLGEDVLESYEEHHVADLLCSELAALDPDRDGSVTRPWCLSSRSLTIWTRRSRTGSRRCVRAWAARSCKSSERR